MKGGGFFRLLLTHAEKPYVPVCDDCLSTEVPGGRTGVDQSQSLADMDADHPWVFRVMFQGDDGRIVIATEKVAGASVGSATQDRVFTDAQLAELVQDPTLVFPQSVGEVPHLRVQSRGRGRSGRHSRSSDTSSCTSSSTP